MCWHINVHCSMLQCKVNQKVSVGSRSKDRLESTHFAKVLCQVFTHTLKDAILCCKNNFVCVIFFPTTDRDDYLSD